MDPTTDPITVLRSDPISVPGQRYCLISVIGPDCPQKGEQLALKIRGAFGTVEEAKSHAAQLIQKDRYVNIFVAAMYEWLPLPPKVEEIEDAKYQEEFLDTLFDDYRKRELEGRAAFAAHKEELRQRAKDEGGAAASSSTTPCCEIGEEEDDLPPLVDDDIELTGPDDIELTGPNDIQLIGPHE